MRTPIAGLGPRLRPSRLRGPWPLLRALRRLAVQAARAQARDLSPEVRAWVSQVFERVVALAAEGEVALRDEQESNRGGQR
jgi:hypothetical protein